MKKIIGVLLLLACAQCYAGGWTNTAVVTRVDLVRNEGIMVWGSFGNPAGCSTGDAFFVGTNHVQYNQVYALIMLAFATGRPISAYAHECDPATWYSIPSVTYNNVTTSGAITLQN
jgi:hypothetical protein